MITNDLEKKTCSRRFSIRFRHQLLGKIAVGIISESEAIKKYQLSTKLLRQWRHWRYKFLTHSKSHTMRKIKFTKENFKVLEQKIKQLEKEKESLRLEAQAYRTMIKIAEKEYDIPIRKKFGIKQ